MVNFQSCCSAYLIHISTLYEPFIIYQAHSLQLIYPQPKPVVSLSLFPNYREANWSQDRFTDLLASHHTCFSHKVCPGPITPEWSSLTNFQPRASNSVSFKWVVCCMFFHVDGKNYLWSYWFTSFVKIVLMCCSFVSRVTIYFSCTSLFIYWKFKLYHFTFTKKH